LKEKRKNNVMNYCCENIKRAYELIGEAKNILDLKPTFKLLRIISGGKFL